MGLPKDKNELYEDVFWIGPYVHAQVTGDTTLQLWLADARCRVLGAQYLNVTGLAEDTTNVFAIKVVKDDGATPVIVASWSSDSDLLAASASIPVDTILPLTLTETDLDRILEPGNWLELLLDEGGAATLPAGSLMVKLAYV